MNPNQKIFVYGSAALLALSLFAGTLHTDEARAQAPSEVTAPAPAEPVAAAKAAPAAAAAAPAAAAAASEPVAARSPEPAKADAPADATDPGCDKAPADCDRAKKGDAGCDRNKRGDCDKADGHCDRGERGCDKADGGCDHEKRGCDKADGGCDHGKRGCDKAAGRCDKADRDCDKGGCKVARIAAALLADESLTDEQVGRIDAIADSYGAAAAARKAEKKQLRQDLRALWESSPMKPAAVKKKAAELDAAVAAAHGARTDALLAMAAVLDAAQYDRADHVFSCTGADGSACADGRCKR